MGCRHPARRKDRVGRDNQVGHPANPRERSESKVRPGGVVGVAQCHNTADAPRRAAPSRVSGDRTARIWETRCNSELAAVYGHHGGVRQRCGHQTDGGSPPRHATARPRSGISTVVANSQYCTATTTRFEGPAWSPDGRQLALPRMTGRPGPGPQKAGAHLRYCRATMMKFGGWGGHRTVGAWLLRHATGPPGSGTPTVASSLQYCAATTTGFGL